MDAPEKPKRTRIRNPNAVYVLPALIFQKLRSVGVSDKEVADTIGVARSSYTRIASGVAGEIGLTHVQAMALAEYAVAKKRELDTAVEVLSRYVPIPSGHSVAALRAKNQVKTGRYNLALFAPRLREACKQKNIPVERIARSIGLGPHWIRELDVPSAGLKALSIERLCQIAERLDVSVDWLCGSD